MARDEIRKYGADPPSSSDLSSELDEQQDVGSRNRRRIAFFRLAEPSDREDVRGTDPPGGHRQTRSFSSSEDVEDISDAADEHHDESTAATSIPSLARLSVSEVTEHSSIARDTKSAVRTVQFDSVEVRQHYEYSSSEDEDAPSECRTLTKSSVDEYESIRGPQRLPKFHLLLSMRQSEGMNLIKHGSDDEFESKEPREEEGEEYESSSEEEEEDDRYRLKVLGLSDVPKEKEKEEEEVVDSSVSQITESGSEREQQSTRAKKARGGLRRVFRKKASKKSLTLLGDM